MKKILSALLSLSLILSITSVALAQEVSEKDGYREHLERAIVNSLNGVPEASPCLQMCCDRPMWVATGSRIDHFPYPNDLTICILTLSHGSRCKNCGAIDVVIDREDYHTPGKYADCPLGNA